MGQLFNRISRVVRAELNSNRDDCQRNYLNGGTALVAGGAITGASMGSVGILAGGTGFAVGAVPLAAAGALTGAALYEALRSIIECDASSASTAAIGAVVGATTSAAIGGVGVAAGGSAIGVGMASMAAGGAVVGLGLVGLDRLLQQGIQPEKLLDSAIEQMEADLKDARQAIVNVITSQKRLQQQYEQAQAEVDKWKRRTQLARQKGDEYLIREALIRKKKHIEIYQSLKVQLNQEPVSVKNLKRNLTLLEAKVSEAKAMRTKLKAQIAAAKVNEQLQNTVDNRGTSHVMSTFERMEEKLLQMELRSQASAELARVDLEQQFAALESGDNINTELEAIKTMVLSNRLSSQPLPSAQGNGSTTTSSITTSIQTKNSTSSAIDAELENLKRQLDEL